MAYPPRASDCKDLTTEDNRTPIVEGMWLFNYYDGFWGKVEYSYATVHNPDLPELEPDGWFYLVEPGGCKTSLNGVRVSTCDPKGTTPPKEQ